MTKYNRKNVITSPVLSLICLSKTTTGSAKFFTRTKMLKLTWLLLLLSFLVSPAWTCGSQSTSDDNFLIEDPVEGPDYDQDYGQSVFNNRPEDRVIMCRIEVLTSTDLRSRYAIHKFTLMNNWENLLNFSAKRSFNIRRRGIVVKSVKVYGNCRWELKNRSGSQTVVIGYNEEKEINMTVKRGRILVD